MESVYQAQSATAAEVLAEFLNANGEDLGLEEGVTFRVVNRSIYPSETLDKFDKGFVAGVCKSYEKLL